MWSRRIPPMLGTTFVDEEAERAKAGMLLAAIVAFIISGWYSFRELNYLLRGRSVEAEVTRMYEYTVPTRHGPSKPRLGIEYRFTDADGQSREDKDWVPVSRGLHGRATVEVQYLPGPEGDSRLAANRSILGPAVFLACLAFVVLGLMRLIREANAPIPRRRSQRGPLRHRAPS
ncbi:MAG: hypothetical protein KF861_13655 [Planctomycetaceae bacterium]|nr:hypothetical protein [Planctomycetaceae bacterium]